MISWTPERVYCNTPKGFGWAIYMKGYNTEYQDANGDNLIFDTKKQALDFINALQ